MFLFGQPQKDKSPPFLIGIHAREGGSYPDSGRDIRGG